MQPSSANKLPIVHILGLLSNLFSTFDLNKQNERLEVMNTVPTQPHNNNPVRQPINTQTPISYRWLASMFESNRPVKWTPNSCSGHFSGGGCPAAGFPSDPDHSQQVAEWTGGGRGQCSWTCVCICGSIWMIRFFLRGCVLSLGNHWRPFSMTLHHWWLSSVSSLVRYSALTHKPQL